MARTESISQHLLVYDGDCAFCTLWVTRLRAWLPVFPPTSTSQLLDADRYALSKDELEKFAWYITPTYHYPGHLAASALLRVQPRVWLRFLGQVLRTPPFSFLAAGIYALVAKTRHRLPGGTQACDPNQAS
jgi:predicted DCC family thiol-disulfide oxidoreductase YuxK